MGGKKVSPFPFIHPLRGFHDKFRPYLDNFGSFISSGAGFIRRGSSHFTFLFFQFLEHLLSHDHEEGEMVSIAHRLQHPFEILVVFIWSKAFTT
nr:hypothetical protein [Candidatus Sigynarchaeum springense]